MWRLNLMGKWMSWPCLARGLDGLRRRDEAAWQSMGMALAVSHQECREASGKWEFWRVRGVDWGWDLDQVACFACNLFCYVVSVVLW